MVHGPDGGGERMACANIVEDKDIVKYATIRTKARFNLATFMEEVQAVMGVPEWFLYTDSRETKSLYGNKCIQGSNAKVPYLEGYSSGWVHLDLGCSAFAWAVSNNSSVPPAEGTSQI